VDAGGRVLMPGFVDAHSRLPAVDLARFGVDLTPPPDGDVKVDGVWRGGQRLYRRMSADSLQ